MADVADPPAEPTEQARKLAATLTEIERQFGRSSWTRERREIEQRMEEQYAANPPPTVKASEYDETTPEGREAGRLWTSHWQAMDRRRADVRAEVRRERTLARTVEARSQLRVLRAIPRRRSARRGGASRRRRSGLVRGARSPDRPRRRSDDDPDLARLRRGLVRVSGGLA